MIIDELYREKLAADNDLEVAVQLENRGKMHPTAVDEYVLSAMDAYADWMQGVVILEMSL